MTTTTKKVEYSLLKGVLRWQDNKDYCSLHFGQMCKEIVKRQHTSNQILCVFASIIPTRLLR